MILYPTETVYGLGVNPFDEAAMQELFVAKGRDERKVSAWLVRNIDDIARYGELSNTALKIAEAFLPGPLTLVLPAKDTVPTELQSDHGTIGLRISSDPHAHALIERFFSQHNVPLTCTSANVSGHSTETTVATIIEQFQTYRPQFTGFAEIIDGGRRDNEASTVVGVIGDNVTIYRTGVMPDSTIMNILT